MISDARIKELVRNAMYGGLNCEDVSLSECIEFAVRTAAEEAARPAPTYHEIGFLSRNRDGEIRWHQTSNMLPFPLHATVNVYMKGVPGSKPQLHDDGN